MIAYVATILLSTSLTLVVMVIVLLGLESLVGPIPPWVGALIGMVFGAVAIAIGNALYYWARS